MKAKCTVRLIESTEYLVMGNLSVPSIFLEVLAYYINYLPNLKLERYITSLQRFFSLVAIFNPGTLGWSHFWWSITLLIFLSMYFIDKNNVIGINTKNCQNEWNDPMHLGWDEGTGDFLYIPTLWVKISTTKPKNCRCWKLLHKSISFVYYIDPFPSFTT